MQQTLENDNRVEQGLKLVMITLEDHDSLNENKVNDTDSASQNSRQKFILSCENLIYDFNM